MLSKTLTVPLNLIPKLHLGDRLRGYAYLMLKRYNDALENFNCAINLRPDNDWYLYHRALATKVSTK
jgi:tetratricopeptide (TPR) repeat protein